MRNWNRCFWPTFAALIAIALVKQAWGHSIYTQMTAGTMCARCSGEDCEPIQVETTETPMKGYYIPASGEFIPAAMAHPSPDERFHRCTWPRNEYWDAREKRNKILPDNSTFDGKPKTRCFWAPVVGM